MIMYQNCWWLIFYLLDVRTSNALELYKEFCRICSNGVGHYILMNIVDFKMQIIEGLVGKKIEDLFTEADAEMEHILTHIEGGVRS